MRILLAAIPAVLLFAACGGDSDSPSGGDAATATTGPTLTAAQARGTEVARGLEQPTATDKPLPTPTRLPDDAPAVQVVGASGAPYIPKLSEFKALPTAEIKVDGQAYSGVTLSTLLAKVNPPSTAIVTIDGVRGDGKRQGAVRFPLSTIGDSTVLTAGKNGELSLASTSIPKDQWLIWVTGISIR